MKRARSSKSKASVVEPVEPTFGLWQIAGGTDKQLIISNVGGINQPLLYRLAANKNKAAVFQVDNTKPFTVLKANTLDLWIPSGKQVWVVGNGANDGWYCLVRG